MNHLHYAARIGVRMAIAVAAGSAAFGHGAAAYAQSSAEADKFPSRPIRAVVPSTPGGALDVLVRLIGPKMSQQWGQQVIADLRPGAGGIIGSEIVAKAPPDGQTILAVANGYALNPLLYSKLPYDNFRDFECITIMAFAPNVLVVHPSLPVRSVRELIALAKTKPGALNYASSGVGTSSYQSAELFLRLAGIKLAHVPYKGAGASMSAVVSGEVPMIFSGASNVLPLVEVGRLRALGVTSLKRMSQMPDVPPVAETVPGYEVQNFFGLLAPARTPRPIIDKLHAEVVRVLKLSDVRDRLLALGFVPGGNSPEEFAAYAQAEQKKWEKVFKELGIKPE